MLIADQLGDVFGQGILEIGQGKVSEKSGNFTFYSLWEPCNMCKYCCSEPLCNNPVKCNNLKCDLSASLRHNSCNHAGLSQYMYLVNTVIWNLLRKISLF